MSTQDYSAILTRLEGLERQARWRQVERLLILTILTWALTSGPAMISFRGSWISMRRAVAGLNPAVVLQWGRAELGSFVTIKPAIDPRIVLEDEREATGESHAQAVPAVRNRSATTPAHKPAPVSQGRSLAPADSAMSLVAQGRMAALATASTSADLGRAANNLDAATLQPTMDQNGSDLGASAREAERNLSKASPQLAVAVPSPSSTISESASTTVTKNAGLAALPIVAPEDPTRSLSLLAGIAVGTSSNSVLSDSSTPAPPVNLKALGYAQSPEGAQAILTDGATLYVANEGEEFADRFRVTGIRPEGLDIEDRRTNTILHLAYGH